jgi:hypothetical protein
LHISDLSHEPPKHSEGTVKPSADIINFKIPRGWKKDQSRGNENIPRVYTFSGGSRAVAFYANWGFDYRTSNSKLQQQ